MKNVLCMLVVILLSTHLANCIRPSAPSTGQQIYKAIFDKDTTALTSILKNGPTEEINAPIFGGRNALVFSIEFESIACLQLLLDHGANPCKDSKSGVYMSGRGTYPILVAAAMGIYPAVEVFLAHDSSSCYTKYDINRMIEAAGHHYVDSERDQIIALIEEFRLSRTP